MHNKLVLQEFPRCAISFAASQISDTADQRKWNILMVFHANLDCYQDSEFFFCDEVKILLLGVILLKGLISLLFFVIIKWF